MTEKQKNDLFESVLFDAEMGETDSFVIVNDRERGSEWPEKYRGLVLHVSDHGNAELYMMFKNGNCRSIASQV